MLLAARTATTALRLARRAPSHLHAAGAAVTAAGARRVAPSRHMSFIFGSQGLLDTMTVLDVTTYRAKVTKARKRRKKKKK